MGEVVSQRELRNDSGAIMRRVEQGESFVVTRNGVPIADLLPHRPDQGPRQRFVPVDVIGQSLRKLPDWGVTQFRAELTALDELVDDTFEPIPFDADAARVYGALCASVRDAGRNPRPRRLDLLSAAVAVTNSLPLLTRNAADFTGMHQALVVIPITSTTV